MFSFTIGTYLSELEKYAPKISKLLKPGYDEIFDNFSAMPDISKLAGSVSVAAGNFIGMGAVVRDGVKINEASIKSQISSNQQIQILSKLSTGSNFITIENLHQPS